MGKPRRKSEVQDQAGKVDPPGQEKKVAKQNKEKKIRKNKNKKSGAKPATDKNTNKSVPQAPAKSTNPATPTAEGPVEKKHRGLMKLSYLHKILSTLWHAIKGLRSYLIQKYSKHGTKKDTRPDEGHDGEEAKKSKPRFEKKLQSLKQLTLYDSKLLMALLLRFQLNEDLDRYWTILNEVYGVRRKHFNILIEIMDERMRATGKGELEDPETLMYSEEDEDDERIGVFEDEKPTQKEYEPQEHILDLYEWLFISQPIEYKKAVAEVVQMINKHKTKSEKKQASRDKNRDKKAKQAVKVQKKKADEDGAPEGDDLLGDLDAFMANNPILQEIHDLRMNTVKRKLKLRKLLAAKRSKQQSPS